MLTVLDAYGAGDKNVAAIAGQLGIVPLGIAISH